MSPALDVQDLMGYTIWQRAIWQAWFAQKGPAPLEVPTGDSDGRFRTIGGLIRHIFSSELSYAERIARWPLTNTNIVAIDDPAALFLLGAVSRACFVGVMETFPASHWNVPLESSRLTSRVRATPRKVVLHVLTHEIRHWAQVATLLQCQGWTGEPPALPFSPVPGDALQI